MAKFTALQTAVIEQLGYSVDDWKTCKCVDEHPIGDLVQTLDDIATKAFIANSIYAPLLLDRPNGIYLSLATHEIPNLHKALVQADISVMSLEIKKSLEDYFLEITSTSHT